MAADVIKAVIDLYNAIPDAAFPNATQPGMYFEEAPAVDGSGTQLRPGDYVILRDKGGRRPEYFSNYGGFEGGTLSVEVYNVDLATADLVAKAIKYGSGTPSQRQGLDFGTLTLASPLSHISLKRTNERRAPSGLNRDGKPVYMVELTYRVVVGIVAS